jgi:hypothetical protein
MNRKSVPNVGFGTVKNKQKFRSTHQTLNKSPPTTNFQREIICGSNAAVAKNPFQVQA